MTQFRYALASTERLQEHRGELEKELAEEKSGSHSEAVTREFIAEINEEIMRRLEQ